MKRLCPQLAPLLVLLLILCQPAACGQQGPLYLPPPEEGASLAPPAPPSQSP